MPCPGSEHGTVINHHDRSTVVYRRVAVGSNAGMGLLLPAVKAILSWPGELTIALLFGTATVIAGWMSQTRTLPPLSVWLVSLVPGMLTAAILAANEVPDCETDSKASKNTLVVLVGRENGYLVFLTFSVAAYIFLSLLMLGNILTAPAAVAFARLIIAYKCATILRRKDIPKEAFIPAAKLSILQQAAVILILIGEKILWLMS